MSNKKSKSYTSHYMNSMCTHRIALHDCETNTMITTNGEKQFVCFHLHHQFDPIQLELQRIEQRRLQSKQSSQRMLSKRMKSFVCFHGIQKQLAMLVLHHSSRAIYLHTSIIKIQKSQIAGKCREARMSAILLQSYQIKECPKHHDV